MVCTTKDLLEWKNFPMGLKVLVLAKDARSASEISSELEGMDYIVSTFLREDEALSAILNTSDAFHIAIIEVNTIDNNDSFMFLRLTKGLPTVMVADDQCKTTTTMKCIELGAIEVLHKPLCDDKLRNIWQHVVRKAYNTGERALPESPTPVTNSTMILTLDEEIQCLSDNHCDDYDKYPAPSTPQLKQLITQDDDGSSAEHNQESKSVETTCRNAATDMTTLDATRHIHAHHSVIKEENDSTNGCKNQSEKSAHQKSKASESRGPCGPKPHRKKMKVEWTSNLHKKFIQAVEQLGIDQAIPSRILELMNVEGLTRHNVASHLQKYRMQRRYILPKTDYNHKSIMTFPHSAYHFNNVVGLRPWCGVMGRMYHQTWPWKSYSTVKQLQADAWGCPMIPSVQSSYAYYPQNATGSYCGVPASFRDDYVADDVIDNMIKEAINKPPWVPLPIGLKPPSTESVMIELYKQGISDIPLIKKHN